MIKYVTSKFAQLWVRLSLLGYYVSINCWECTHETHKAPVAQRVRVFVCFRIKGKTQIHSTSVLLSNTKLCTLCLHVGRGWRSVACHHRRRRRRRIRTTCDIHLWLTNTFIRCAASTQNLRIHNWDANATQLLNADVHAALLRTDDITVHFIWGYVNWNSPVSLLHRRKQNVSPYFIIIIVFNAFWCANLSRLNSSQWLFVCRARRLRAITNISTCASVCVLRLQSSQSFIDFGMHIARGRCLGAQFYK